MVVSFSFRCYRLAAAEVLTRSLPRNKWTLYTITDLVDTVHFVILRT